MLHVHYVQTLIHLYVQGGGVRERGESVRSCMREPYTHKHVYICSNDTHMLHVHYVQILIYLYVQGRGIRERGESVRNSIGELYTHKHVYIYSIDTRTCYMCISHTF